MPRSTEQAHRLIASTVAPGDWAIDLTAGNGHDTFFLLNQVGQGGVVFAFDAQQGAIEKTRTRCAAFGDSLKLLCDCHSRVRDFIPNEAHGKVGAVVANLGYLPGGDTAITTHESTSVVAVRESLPLLRPGGIVSVICYRGHPGGEEETVAMMGFFEGLNRDEWRVEIAVEALRHPVQPVWCRAQRDGRAGW